MSPDADRICWAGPTSGTSTSCTVPSGNTAVKYNALGDRRSIGTNANAIVYDQAHLATPPELATGHYLREIEYLLARGATFLPGDLMQMAGR